MRAIGQRARYALQVTVQLLADNIHAEAADGVSGVTGVEESNGCCMLRQALSWGSKLGDDFMLQVVSGW